MVTNYLIAFQLIATPIGFYNARGGISWLPGYSDFSGQCGGWSHLAVT